MLRSRTSQQSTKSVFRTNCKKKKTVFNIEPKEPTLLYSLSNERAATTCPSCSVIKAAAPAVPPVIETKH